MGNLLLANGNPMFGVSPDGRGIYIFTLEIYYYALCIVLGMLVAAMLSALLMKRRNMSSDFVFLLFVVCIPTAIVGARLFSCLTDPELGIKSFFKFRDGGLSITGSIIGGIGSGYIVCKIKKVNFLRADDCVVINMLIAQALGRWGNFFNAEVYGGAVTDPNLQFFPLAVPIVGGMSGVQAFSHLDRATWHYAFFFYEACLNLLGWAILFTTAWFRKKKPNGLLVCLYLVWYGAVRTVMEPLRSPEFILNNHGIPWSHLFSILMVGLGVCGCLLLMIFNFKKEGAFVGSVSGDSCGLTQYLTPYKNDPPYFSRINMLGGNYPPRPPKEDRKKRRAQDDTAEEGKKTEASEEEDKKD